MSVIEARILTIQWDSRTGMFDDSVLRHHLVNRELVRCVPQFFEHRGVPCWSLYIETTIVQGAVIPRDPVSPEQQATMADIAAQITQFDEIQKVRYERILAWRADRARQEGFKSYMICTNRQALDLARDAPATLAALGRVHGFGDKKVAKYGRQLLEILHGNFGTVGNAGGVRKVDAGDKGIPSDVGGIPEASASIAVQPHGNPVPGNSGTPDDGGLHQESGPGFQPD
ncbi:HRDC domain-containing protein [Myxococcota bacterium]|nr:HRDC domain-containing protein [Myxococcota bacterium]